MNLDEHPRARRPVGPAYFLGRPAERYRQALRRRTAR
jgi:hypothetical protein